LAAAIGPLPLAMSNDRLGTYGPVLIAYAMVPLVSMAFVLSAKKPVRVSG
jgi:hypothetical protein